MSKLRNCVRVFLSHMHEFLARQELHYRLYLVNQVDSDRFNRGMLINVGFEEALKDFAWDCFIFHDVDLLPEDDRNLYTCPGQPRHMSVGVDKWKYKLPYPDIFGGVVAIPTNIFRQLNGFSNQFWGWGGEDDDMRVRIRKLKLRVERYSPNIARYTMIRREEDGLKDLRYHLVSRTNQKLYTNVTVEIQMPKSLVDLEEEAARKEAAAKAAKEAKKKLKERNKHLQTKKSSLLHSLQAKVDEVKANESSSNATMLNIVDGKKSTQVTLDGMDSNSSASKPTNPITQSISTRPSKSEDTHSAKVMKKATIKWITLPPYVEDNDQSSSSPNKND